MSFPQWLGPAYRALIITSILLNAVTAQAAKDPCKAAVSQLGDRRLALAREAFHEAAKPPPEDERDEESVARWHETALRKARRVLDLQGVLYDVVELEDGYTAIAIRARDEASELNRFAFSIREQLGVELVYQPEQLVRDDGSMRRATYNHRERRIYLSRFFVDGVQADHSLHHEVLHAVFKAMRAQGQESLFHAELQTVSEDGELWDYEAYQGRMSLEELATYPLNLRLAARDLEALAKGAGEEGLPWNDAKGLVREIKTRGEKLHHLAAGTARHLRRFLTALEGGRGAKSLEVEIHVRHLRAKTTAERDATVGEVYLILGDIRLEQVLVSSEMSEKAQRYAEIEGVRGHAAERKALRAAILGEVETRVQLQLDIARKLKDQAKRAADVADELKAAWKSGAPDADQLAAWLAEVAAPRETTLPYIEWRR